MLYMKVGVDPLRALGSESKHCRPKKFSQVSGPCENLRLGIVAFLVEDGACLMQNLQFQAERVSKLSAGVLHAFSRVMVQCDRAAAGVTSLDVTRFAIIGV